MRNKYRIELSPTKPRPKEKVTGLGWDELVKFIKINGVFIVKKIRLNNVGIPKGNEHISGKAMLKLWIEVAREK